LEGAAELNFERKLPMRVRCYYGTGETTALNFILKDNPDEEEEEEEVLRVIEDENGDNTVPSSSLIMPCETLQRSGTNVLVRGQKDTHRGIPGNDDVVRQVTALALENLPAYENAM